MNPDLSYSCTLLRELRIVLILSFHFCVCARRGWCNHLLALSIGMLNGHWVEVLNVCVNVVHAHRIVVFLQILIHGPPILLVPFLWFSLLFYLPFLNVLIIFPAKQLGRPR